MAFVPYTWGGRGQGDDSTGRQGGQLSPAATQRCSPGLRAPSRPQWPCPNTELPLSWVGIALLGSPSALPELLQCPLNCPPACDTGAFPTHRPASPLRSETPRAVPRFLALSSALITTGLAQTQRRTEPGPQGRNERRPVGHSAPEAAQEAGAELGGCPGPSRPGLNPRSCGSWAP